MIEIILDASQLELFESCPRKWYYMYHLNLIPRKAHRAFNIGSYYHEVLARYYYLSIRPVDEGGPLKDIHERIRNATDFAGDATLLHRYGLKDLDTIKFHRQRLIDYLFYHIDEDESLKTIAVEQGFSTLLYEDSYRRYILEGRIDLVGEGPPYKQFVMDHKTQSRYDDKYELNHQVMNYMAFTGSDYFIYNYIGLQDKLPAKGMRRMVYQPHPEMLEQWKFDVIRTFHEMEDYVTRSAQDGPLQLLTGEEQCYPRRRQACDASKYGLCPYYKLCSIPDNSKWVPAVRSAYKEKEEKWQAWR